MKYYYTLFILFLISTPVLSQSSFPEKCIGTWKGNLHIYSKGLLKDTVPSTLFISETDDPEVFIWKTVYNAPQKEIVKDYTMKLQDSIPNMYITDEGDGIQLKMYEYNNKLFSVFEVEGNLLTSTYELQKDQLIFEIISGKQLDKTETVTNYSVSFLQRVVYIRAEE